MILGVGTDLVDLMAFGKQIGDGSSNFLSHSFTAGERAYSEGKSPNNPTRHLGARYAAKEAFIKAWSASIAPNPPPLRIVDMRHIEVIQDEFGRPSLRLHGAILKAAGHFRTHLSLSHDGNNALAFVVISNR